MEHYYYKNLKELAIKLSSQPMNKMITRLLVSVSIFSSLLFSLSSLYSSSPLIMYFENLNSFSSKYTSFQMILGGGMNKNFVFLICNGLLVFLAKTSGSVCSPSPSATSVVSNDMLTQNKTCDDGFEIVTETKPEPEVADHVGINGEIISEVPVLLEKDIITFEEICECKEEEEDEHVEIQEVIECSSTEITANEVSVFVAEISDQEEEAAENDENVPVKFWLSDGDDQLKEEEVELEVLHGEEEEEEEEEEKFVDDEMEKLSTEELNQKFEDFIRRMKEEFRVNNGATQGQQLVMVN